MPDVKAQEGTPQVSARSYVLYCPQNRKVILSHNMDTPMGMASTTKIMTALLTLEYAQKEDKVVTFTSRMTAEGSSMYLKVGDKVRLSDLAAGMMTVSGNDAANAAAVSIGKSMENFAKLMNSRAKEIGMKNTNFVNPSGLPCEGHYSTAYDMALLMSYALENEDFRALSAKKCVEVDFINPPAQRVTYTNHNKLLWRYEYCTGGKTGYTRSDGRCLVSSSTKDNLDLVAVTLNASDDWNDHKALFDYGYENYCAVQTGKSSVLYDVRVLSSDKERVRACAEGRNEIILTKEDAEKLTTQVYLEPVVFAPVSEGQVLGRIRCTLDGKVVYTAHIKSVEGADYAEISGFLRLFRRLFR